MTETTRAHDLVLYGATGYTGRLVAEYLAGRPNGAGLRWALGGRDRARLADARAALAARWPALADLPLVVADAHDPAALAALAGTTRVVCTTAGPYARHGSELVAACVAAGTDYCDLTGEVHWMRRMIDAHHDEAARRGVRIVHCCGVDSIPSDLGTFMVQEAMRARHGAPAREVRTYVRRFRGGFSGGTVASMLGTFDALAADPGLGRLLGDPYALAPAGEPPGPDGRDRRGLGRHPGGGTTAPFVMAAVNTRVVRRSNALLDYAWGRDFSYDEAFLFPPGPRGLARAAAMLAGFGALAAGMALTPTRALLERFVLPAPGEGPSPAARARGSFAMTLEARGPDADGVPREVRGRVESDLDPGYGATAVMLGEAALALAAGERGPVQGGVLTPATALGAPLLGRLRAAGMRWEIV